MDYKQKLISILENAKTIGEYNQAVLLNDSLNLLTKKEMYKYLNRKVQKVFGSFLADLLYFTEALDYSEKFGNGIYDSGGVNVDRLVSKTIDPLIDKLLQMGVEPHPYDGVSFNETKKEMEQYLRENRDIVSSI